MPSSATTLSCGSRTSGLTSTSVASSETKVSHSLTMTSAAWSATSAGIFAGGDDLGGLRPVDAGDRVDRDAGQRVGALDGELLDLHAALGGAHREERAVGAVQQEREVVLLGDVAGLGDQHAVHDVALDVEAEDRLGLLARLVGGLGQLHAAGLAAAAGLDLRLDDDGGAELGGRGRRVVARRRPSCPAGPGLRARRRDPSPGTRRDPLGSPTSLVCTVLWARGSDRPGGALCGRFATTLATPAAPLLTWAGDCHHGHAGPSARSLAADLGIRRDCADTDRSRHAERRGDVGHVPADRSEREPRLRDRSVGPLR